MRLKLTLAVGLAASGCKRDEPPPAATPPPTEAEAPVEELDAVEPLLRVGYDNVCIVADDDVWCWGSNRKAKLGQGLGDPCAGDGHCLFAPTRVAAFDRAVDVALGASHTCLLDGAGGVSCLGSHDHGALGLGNTVTTTCTVGGQSTPKCAMDLDTEEITCAGTTTTPIKVLPCAHAPTAVPDLTEVDELRVSGSTSCALSETGTLRCAGGMGLRSWLELSERCGDDEDPCTRSFAEVVPTGVIDVAFAWGGGCLLMLDGQVRCEDGQLRALSRYDDALAIAVGSRHGCVLHRDHALTCAGWNVYGQLGLGSTDEPAAPPGLAPRLLDDVTMVAVGANFSCAVRGEGALWCWGLNGAGQLGQGDTDDRHSPIKVPGIPPVSQIGAGGDSVCIIGTDTSVWCWGAHDRGQLGIGRGGGTTCKTDRIFDPVIPCATNPTRVEVDLG